MRFIKEKNEGRSANSENWPNICCDLSSASEGAKRLGMGSARQASRDDKKRVFPRKRVREEDRTDDVGQDARRNERIARFGSSVRRTPLSTAGRGELEMSDSRDRGHANRDADIVGDPLHDVEGLIVDPFAPNGLGEDPIALAERVAFKLWSDGDVGGRAIEQARKDAGDLGRIDQILVRQGLVDPEAAARALAEELNAPFADLDAVPATPVLPETLPMKFVAEASALPLADDGEVLRLALSDPMDDFTLRAIAMKTRRKLELFIASADAIREAIAQIYRGAPSADLRETTPRRLFDEPAKPARAPRAPHQAPMRAQAPVEEAQREKAPLRANEPLEMDEPVFVAPRRKRADPKRDAIEPMRDAIAPRRPRAEPKEDPFVAPRFASDADFDDDFAVPDNGPDEHFEESFTAPRRAPLRSREAPSPDERPAGARAKLDALRGMPSRRTEGGRNAPPAAAIESEAAPAAPPRRRGVVSPSASADADDRKPASAEGDMRRPKFVRPKRVTLKDRPDLAARAGRLNRESAEMELDPLAIPPMEEDGAAPAFDAYAEEEAPVRRRFMRGFVGGFTGGDEPNEAPTSEEKISDAPISQSRSRRRARDEAARRLVASEVRAALRGDEEEVAEAPLSPARDPIPMQAQAVKDCEQPAASPSTRGMLASLTEGEGGQISATAYQAAAALAQRERRRERARAAAEAKQERGAAVRHQLTTKKVDAAAAKASGKGGSVVADLEALGYREGAREALEAAVLGGEGLVLICGPSGAGKTSTSAALAKRAAGVNRGVERFDRPVEQRESDAPDRELVMMGSISDAESADAAARAAMRGALVLATLDVESVASAAPRLISMGLPPFALASCLRAVAAQHLAPRVCSRCAGSGRSIRGGGECPQCNGTGIDGQVNIVEVMAMDDAVRALILAKAPEEAFRHAMTAAGTPTLADDAAAKVAAGLTDADGAAAATAAARL